MADVAGEPPDPAALWPLPGPWRLRPTGGGTNNRSWFAESPAGADVLRVYENAVTPARVRREHAILRRLQGTGLSFAVPAPLPTRAGGTVARLPRAGGEALAALFPHLPGEHPRPGDAAQARAAGAALGELDAALQHIALAPNEAAGALPTYGALDRIHPAVPDPARLPDELALGSDERDRLAAVFTFLAGAAPPLYAALPRQLIHSDFGRSNTLMAGGRVTGILDFEFASPDLRAMDCAVGLYQYAAAVWGTGAAWAVLDAFAAGYARRVRLADAELRALPTLIRLRLVVTLIHRAGRWRQGLASADDVRERAADALRGDAWLRAHGEELVARVARARESTESDGRAGA
ncbi:MAG TPA: phosphotransferase [Thermomicrobiales bacterium]|nr:phosphotransferase [Thermomicrobiales bacterium]